MRWTVKKLRAEWYEKDKVEAAVYLTFSLATLACMMSQAAALAVDGGTEARTREFSS